MSRSGYSDEYEGSELAMYRGQVASAIRGKHGQALLTELGAAMDAMPVKSLIADNLEEDGEYCALGVVGAARGINLEELDPEETHEIGQAFNIAHQLAAEIAYINDEWGSTQESSEARWGRVRAWVAEQTKT